MRTATPEQLSAIVKAMGVSFQEAANAMECYTKSIQVLSPAMREFLSQVCPLPHNSRSQHSMRRHSAYQRMGVKK